MTPSGSAESSAVLPAQDRPDLFPGTFPIGVDATGRAVVVYLATRPWTDDLRSFLAGHLPLLAVTPTWTLRIVFPPSLQRVVTEYQRAVHDELENRLDAQAINDLQWYFFHTRRQTNWREYKAGAEGLKARFARCVKAFAGPRFARLYRLWLTDREAALTPVPLAISEAFAAGRAGLESIVLPHDYDHLSPLVSRRHVQRRRNTADAEEGDETPRGINRSLNRPVNRGRASLTDVLARRSSPSGSLTRRSACNDLRTLAARQMGRRSVPPLTGVPIRAETEPRT